MAFLLVSGGVLAGRPRQESIPWAQTTHGGTRTGWGTAILAGAPDPPGPDVRPMSLPRTLVLLAFAVVPAACGDPAPSQPDSGVLADAQGDSTPTDVPPTDAPATDVPAPGDATATDTASPDSDTAAPKPAPDFDHVLPQDHVLDLRIDFQPGVWKTLLEDWQKNAKKTEHPAAFQHDGEKLASIGVRLKGLNSMGIPPDVPVDLAGKYPLKLDFDQYGGPRFHGVEALSLNTMAQDPSLMRERLGYRMYQAMKVPATRTAYAKVQVDGVPVGLYTVAHPIDKRFLTEHFGKAGDADEGNLYKCVYNQHGICLLPWLGKDKAAYYKTDCVSGFDECGLVQKTNEKDPAQNDYADLIHFLDVLHHAPQETFAQDIAEVFDVDAFLRLSAVAFAISNHDSYFGKGHNYYLYRRPDTGKFVMIPWDLDLTYGTVSCEGDIGDPTCGQAGSHPLVQRVLAVPANRSKYLAYLQEVVDQYLTPQQHAAWAKDYHALVGSLVGTAPNPSPVGSYEAAVGKDGTGGELAAFVEGRRKDILQRLAAGK